MVLERDSAGSYVCVATCVTELRDRGMAIMYYQHAAKVKFPTSPNQRHVSYKLGWNPQGTASLLQWIADLTLVHYVFTTLPS